MNTTPPATLRILAEPGPSASMRENNPYCYLLYSNMDAEVVDYSWRTALYGKFDVFHLHWPETELNLLGAMKATLKLKKKLWMIDHLRARGTKVFWTVHNFHSHERRHPRLEAWFWGQFTRRLDGFIALTTTGAEAAKSRFPDLRRVSGYIVPHGHYRTEYPNGSIQSVRRILNIPFTAKVLLFFGQVRPYKNIAPLICAFKELPDPNLILLVAGACRSGDLSRELEILAASDSRIRLDLRHIATEQVQVYMNAADLVVLPYRQIQNSGTALLALSFDRPVLLPNLGAMQELAATVGSGWVRLFSGEISSSALHKALEWLDEENRGHTAPLDQLDWKNLAARTLEAYREVCRL